MALATSPDTDLLRQKTAEAARDHRASWIELGQFLYTIAKDKQYRRWGYLSFETYCQKELALKQSTALKLLKSYHFLEQEEPRVAAKQFEEDEPPRKIPSYESVNLLRLAKQKGQLEGQDLTKVREAVLEAGREPSEVRAQIREMVQNREPEDPAGEKKIRRNSALRRLVGMLNSAKRHFSEERLVPAYLLNQITALVEKLENQIES